MKRNFADRLIDAVRQKKTPAVVALDPVYTRLPAEVKGRSGGRGPHAELVAIVAFCSEVIRVVAPLVPAIKVNSAYFERYLAKGVEAYIGVIREAAARGVLVIGDVKRGDVGHSAEQYAAAHLLDSQGEKGGSRSAPDAVTINGYFGLDGVRPFVEVATGTGRGVFVLVRTSNTSAATVQDIVTLDGRKMHEVVASLVRGWASDPRTVGRFGYSSVGAVVAATDRADAVALREAMPSSIFLVPGYGTQGRTADDVQPYFKPDGTGAIVAAGRSIIYAFEGGPDREATSGEWLPRIEQACKDFISDLGRVAGIV